MNKEFIFDFKTDITEIDIPDNLNNPFGLEVPDIVKIAAKEFQEFIAYGSELWVRNLSSEKGKMFGVLVVRTDRGGYSYLGALSGKMPKVSNKIMKLVPSVFDDSIGDYFIDRGMLELTDINQEIKISTSQTKIDKLLELRKIKSIALQRRLFENYKFQNIIGIEKSVLEIFECALNSKPPSAAGECALPKMLHYAFKNNMKPIALAEFWWGKSTRSEERIHLNFYPACKSRCKPIIEFILDDFELFNQAILI